MLENLTKQQQLIILGLVLMIVSGLGVMAFRHYSPGESNELLIENPSPQEAVQHSGVGQLIVHVSGAVKREGVYKLKHGDRIIDALNLAGGATALANLSSINLAEKVKDGQRVTIPVKQILVERRSGELVNRGSGTSSGGKVNLNTASEKDLCKLKGIGKSTAERIVQYRTANGPFSKIEDIVKVKRIGKSLLNKIKDEISI